MRTTPRYLLAFHMKLLEKVQGRRKCQILKIEYPGEVRCTPSGL